MDFYQIMTLIAVAAFVVLVVYAVITLVQVKHTAEAVEYLSTLAAENVEKTQSTFDLLDNVSSLLDSTLYRALGLGVRMYRKYRSRHGK